MFNINQGLNKNKTERAEHLKALDDVFADKDYNRKYTFLYNNLSILDSKASSLLTFNALGLAVLAVWLGGVPANVFHVALDFAFLLLLISCIFCLVCVRLYWSSTKNLIQRDVHLDELLERRDRRSKYYRRARMLSLTALIVVLVPTVLHSLVVFLYAFGICSEADCQYLLPIENWGIHSIHGEEG